MVLNHRMFSADDVEKVVAAIDQAKRRWLTFTPHLDAFRSIVRRGRGVPSAEMPGDVITMNSRFTLENVNTRQWGYYTLVYPEDAADEEGRISVLSPAGMALLGARVSEEVCWTSSAGPEVAVVTRLIHQPEAAMRTKGNASTFERHATAIANRN